MAGKCGYEAHGLSEEETCVYTVPSSSAPPLESPLLRSCQSCTGVRTLPPPTTSTSTTPRNCNLPGCRPGSSSGIFGQWFVEEVEGFERLFCRSTAKPSMTPEPKAATKDVKIDLFEDDDDFDEFEINEDNCDSRLNNSTHGDPDLEIFENLSSYVTIPPIAVEVDYQSRLNIVSWDEDMLLPSGLEEESVSLPWFLTQQLSYSSDRSSRLEVDSYWLLGGALISVADLDIVVNTNICSWVTHCDLCVQYFRAGCQDIVSDIVDPAHSVKDITDLCVQYFRAGCQDIVSDIVDPAASILHLTFYLALCIVQPDLIP
ncbi:hypothetical protein D0Y65_021853 [Glycine soja]|uniref:Uncharacterized protein n=1 Tax=Glycine soja TaxID=3848 RepID=A0A445JKY7_GLYSO|nr:hypothetical protein D0Y65_021853 [Glycine soja]